MTPPPRQRATVHDVVARAGVSRGTVSRFLNGTGYVSADAAARIEAAIEAVGYVRNNAARNLVTQRSMAVGFVVHEPHQLFLGDPNIGSIMLGTNDALADAGYQLVVLVVASDSDAERVSTYLRGGFVDGVVLVSARTHDAVAEAVEKIALPAAVIGQPEGGGSLPHVAIDNHAAAREITERLVATGRRRVGMLASALDRDSGADRLAGFTEALGERFDESLVVTDPLYSYTSGVRGMAELLRRDPSVDGVFAASDAVAAGAIETLRAHGRRIPEDVGIVGFDDSDWAQRCTPKLSTVAQPAHDIGHAAARLVLDQLRSPEAAANVTLPTTVVWRASA
ncbi:LacI family DNA-binding transcriptional regulator [Paraoerskovia marina]|uniref:DNA-binding transcriptional regulator, LacI/PurR family n=1 Tax=Paraoerskovia marina TaxID=545619 RepID=A0A1H1NFF1_9CELL|nr:LacI family DNA-binding transcriptional regulator [Paraoerskovia marina]SDR97711.1 DNA-binding transcriptional regulator, LacI/PurR family [Paraoerskovia marina]